MTAKEVIYQITKLNSYVFTLGRISFVEQLIRDSIKSKLLCAQNGHILLNEAINIENILIKFLNQKKGNYKWDPATYKYIVESLEKSNMDLLLKLKSDYEEKCACIIYFLEQNFGNDLLVIQFMGCLNRLSEIFVSKIEKGEILKTSPLNVKGSKNVQRVLIGPSKIKIDKSFEPSYNILENPTPEFGNTLEEIVPYFWSLSLREILASELCSLSIIEYDNLPLQFYWDFSKQSWDEARHSEVYLNLSISFFDNLSQTLESKNKLYLIIESYNLTGKGLPVPKEKNMYEAILNSELEERLILMNILTEAPAIGRLIKKMKRSICNQYPEIKRTFEFDKIDETFHARIGNYWLKYLIPDPTIRRQKIEDTKMLRGILLLISISEYSDINLIEMAAELIN